MSFQLKHLELAGLCCLIGCYGFTAQANSNVTTLALIEGQAARRPAPAVSATLQAAWFRQAGVTLVERDAVQKIVQEHQLAAANLTAIDSRLQLGRIIPADVLLFVQCVQGMPTPATRIDLTESRTGITLGSWIRDDADIQSHTAAVMEELGEALQKRQVPPGQRHLVGLLEFRGEESGLGLENQAVALGELAMPAISRIPNVIVLDREHLDHLRTEKELTALDQELRASLSLLEGGVRRTPDRKGLAVTVVLRPVAGGAPQNRMFDVLTNDIVGARTRVAAAVAEMLKTGPPKAVELDRAKEAALFGEQARCWDKWGDHARAVRAADAGFALDDSQTCRFLLIQTLVSGSEPSLSASVRANQLLLDYYARQREKIASGGTTNLVLPEIGYSPALGNPEIRTRDPDAAQQLVRLENEAFRTRLEHYTRYHPQTDDAYWNTWHARLASLGTAAPGDLPRQGQLFWEGVQTVLKAPHNEDPLCASRLQVLFALHEIIRGCPHVWQGSNYVVVEGAFYHEIIEKMIAHKDPYVRLVGHHARLIALGWQDTPRTVSREEIESRRALFDTIINEIPPDHRYRESRSNQSYGCEFSIMRLCVNPKILDLQY